MTRNSRVLDFASALAALAPGSRNIGPARVDVVWRRNGFRSARIECRPNRRARRWQALGWGRARRRSCCGGCRRASRPALPEGRRGIHQRTRPREAQEQHCRSLWRIPAPAHRATPGIEEVGGGDWNPATRDTLIDPITMRCWRNRWAGTTFCGGASWWTRSTPATHQRRSSSSSRQFMPTSRWCARSMALPKTVT